MATLATRLGEAEKNSDLLPKAKQWGLNDTHALIRLAIARGCHLYSPGFPASENDPGIEVISNEERVALLLLGENECEPFEIRCAAQLACGCDAEELARLAVREEETGLLAYISDAALNHDERHAAFWKRLKSLLGTQAPVSPGALPPWSRFVLQTGVTREGAGSVHWLHPE